MKSLLLLCALGLASPAFAFDRFRLQPVDEGTKDASLVKFRNELKSTIGRRDVKALLKVVSPKIRHSFGPDSVDAASFAKEWKLDGKSFRESPLWEELRIAISNGGAFQEGKFVAPYVFTNWPDRYDSFDYLVVTEKSAILRVKPEEGANPLETLSYELVARDESRKAPKGWRAVKTADGKQGYLRADEARSPLDYRAGFAKEKAGWKLVFFLSGD